MASEHDNHEQTDAAGPTSTAAHPPMLAGVLAEFQDVDSVMAAAKRVRAAGFTRWDVHSPFPIHGMDAAMGIRMTILPWIVLGAGLSGLLTAIALQFYTNAFDYKYIISGKPYLSWQANVPVMFELTVLFSALAAVFGMLGLNKLPRLYNPLFRSARFRRVTNDRFFVVIDATDPKFDEVETPRLLASFGATAVENVED